ncbi:MAG: AAA family ATPase, partial [Bacteroidota bacterium]|nr:AAA family ATPase [Bacteroidota bacterium]
QEKDIISRQFLKRIGEGNIIKFSSKYKTLPNCINQFLINGFHNISKMHIKGIPKNTQWIFLTGENGYGKSLILQALTIVFFGRNEDNGFLLDKSKTIKGFISLYEENFTSKKDNFQTYIFNTKNNSFEENDSTKNSFENFAAYGPARIRKSADRKSKTYNLFHNDGTLIDIEAKFREWYDAGFLHIIYEDVKKIFLKLLSPYIDDIKIIIDKEKSSKTVKYHEKESKDDVWLEYNELASGYKSIIATFGDMIIRLTEGNKSSNISELSGIVLIDEFDLHLHPKWQKELVEKLTKVFPKVQFIVSTHSPIPILGAPENSIIINVDRDKENGITAKILDVDFKNLTPNSILTSPIFNFHSIIPESNTDLKDLQTKDDYDDIIFQKKVKQKLNDFVQENKDIDKEFDNE